MQNDRLSSQTNGKFRIFSRPQMMMRFFPLSSFCEILVYRQISLNSEIVGISRILRCLDELENDTWNDRRVPCGSRVGDTWHMGGPSVMPSNHA